MEIYHSPRFDLDDTKIRTGFDPFCQMLARFEIEREEGNGLERVARYTRRINQKQWRKPRHTKWVERARIVLSNADVPRLMLLSVEEMDGSPIFILDVHFRLVDVLTRSADPGRYNGALFLLNQERCEICGEMDPDCQCFVCGHGCGPLEPCDQCNREVHGP